MKTTLRAPPWCLWPPWSRPFKKTPPSKCSMNVAGVTVYLLLILTCTVVANKYRPVHSATTSVVATPALSDPRRNEINLSKDPKKLFSTLDASADGFLSENEVTEAIQMVIERHQNM